MLILCLMLSLVQRGFRKPLQSLAIEFCAMILRFGQRCSEHVICLTKKKPEEYQPLIDHLNALPPVDGWFTQMYGGHPNGGCAIQADGLKRPWQIHNTRKLDAIRQEIENLKLDKVDKAVALTSLILALDQVDNTLGHFVSYLREWAPRSYNNLVLKVPLVFPNTEQNEVFREDVFDLLGFVA